MTVQYSTAVRNARLDVVESTIGATAVLKIFAGVQPANCAASNAGSPLATLTLPSDWMAAASSGAKAMSGTWEASALADGAASHFRIYASDGTTCGMQGSVTATGEGGDMEITTTAIISGRSISVSTFILTGGNSTYSGTIFAGTTAGSAVGVVGSGGALPTGWTYELSFDPGQDAILTVDTATHIVEGIECITLTLESGGSEGVLFTMNVPDVAGVSVSPGDDWRFGTYIRQDAFTGSDLSVIATSLFSDNGVNQQLDYDEYALTSDGLAASYRFARDIIPADTTTAYGIVNFFWVGTGALTFTIAAKLEQI